MGNVAAILLLVALGCSQGLTETDVERIVDAKLAEQAVRGQPRFADGEAALLVRDLVEAKIRRVVNGGGYRVERILDDIRQACGVIGDLGYEYVSRGLWEVLGLDGDQILTWVVYEDSGRIVSGDGNFISVEYIYTPGRSASTFFSAREEETRHVEMQC